MNIITPTTPVDENQSTEKVVSTDEVSVNGGTSGALADELTKKPETISLGNVNLDGKQVNLTMELFTLGNPQQPKMYFLEADGKMVDYYSKQDGHEILEGGKGVYDNDDITVDGNTVYMRDGNKHWLKYTIEKKRDDKIGFVLQKRLEYNPLKLKEEPRMVGVNGDIQLIEYTNPPQRGHIDPDFYKPTAGKILVIPNRYKESSKKVEFPQKEGVAFDEKTIKRIDYELYIRDIHGKLYRYEINVVTPELRELPIRDEII